MPSPTERPFRFGIVLHTVTNRREWRETCRRAEQAGFDTIAVIDHLGQAAPFPALMLAAEATERVRLGTYVLDATFHHPALLVRDVATLDLLTDGRLELGLAAGRPSAAPDDLRRAGMPCPTPAERADALEGAVAALRRLHADQRFRPGPGRPLPPLLVAGRGERALRLAAREADIVAVNGTAAGPGGQVGLPAFAGADAIERRAAFVRAELGERITEVELNHEAPAVVVTNARRQALDRLSALAPSLTAEERGQVPGFLVGTPAQIAEQIRRNREKFGFTYVTVLDGGLDAMAPVIELLR
ncbi:putative F420-dependent oxidoreductase [Nonomuraea thailandensis]|uniref:F420-dependent oxidoreductase n=1 Tax=Nonomuraea thailandensis TaxID=1188745 RepID=A0A9X2K8B0_9ACTN|nr:TIGR03621 family F420-dependent LLM class oxidoreductase [Nonomuraea thailandensis]MCP2363460.1 putative F420-dependent oxidoreductase [Nonomuraea thailandensis]